MGSLTWPRAAVGAPLACLAVIGAAWLTSLASGSLVSDQSLALTAPAPLTTVSPPFVVSWTTSGHRHSRFGVFVDQSPIAPGQTLRVLATTQCQREPGCRPDASYLAGLGVYVTSSDHVRVPVLQPLAGTDEQDAHPVHTVTVVLMNAQGRRIGEAAWQVEFRA